MLLSELNLVEQLMAIEARESFWAYRRFMNPKMKLGWWQREIANELQAFYEKLVAGERPKLVIEAPPQHGKSKTIVDFITWVAGKSPDTRTIYTSFSERLGIRANLWCQRLIESRKYKLTFPETRINEIGMGYANTLGATRSRELLEFIGHEGSFRNTTVNGQVTGESLDLGVIDDPIKGRAEARSQTVRDATWDWFTDDFFTRFSDDAGLLSILTRWHLDDPIGRLRKEFGDAVKVLSYPALATKDEKHRMVDEPLFPELKSLEFLLERKKVMASANWEALYQQNPREEGGELIKGGWFVYYKQLPPLKHRIVYADTAQKTKEHNDYSVFECWGMTHEGRICLVDLIRGKWEAPELKRRAKAFWAKHKATDAVQYGQLRAMKIEDKASGTGLIQEIRNEASIPVIGIERNKDKYTRFLDIESYIESGYVMIPEEATFTNDFVEECEAFTADDTHTHDDQIDPMMDAIEDMLATTSPLGVWSKLGK